VAVDVGAAGGGADELARLGVVVEGQGVDETVASFDRMAQAGESAAQRMGTAGSQGASTLERAYTESVGRTRQVVETQLNALVQLTSGVSVASKEAVGMAQSFAATLREEADAGRLTTEQLAQLAQAERALAGASQQSTATASAQTAIYERRAIVLAQLKALDEESARSGAALANVTRASASAVEAELPLYERRAVVLAHMAALEQDAAKAAALDAAAAKEDAAANAASATGVEAHGLQLGRLNQELGTFLGRLTGSNTAVTRLGAQVFGAVAGYGIAVAALSAVAAGYELIAKDAGEAKKAAEDFEKTTAARQAAATGIGAVRSATGFQGSTLNIPALSEDIDKSEKSLTALGKEIADLPRSFAAFDELKAKVQSGAITSEEFAKALEDVARTPNLGTFYADQIEQLGRLGSLYLANAERIRALTAELEHAAATNRFYTQTLGGLSVDEGKLTEQIDERRRVLAAYQSGGQAAGRSAEAEASAVELARKLYEDYAKSGKDASLATLAFGDALKTQNPVVLRFLADARALAKVNLQIGDAQRQATSTPQVSARLTSLGDEIKRFAAEAASFGKDGQIDARVQSYADALAHLQTQLDQDRATHKLSQAEYAKDSALLAELTTQLQSASAALRQAASDQLTRQIDEQYTAEKRLYDALVDGSGSYHELTAAKAADLEIDQKRRALGHDLTQAQQDEIRQTHELAAAIESAKTAEGFEREAAAARAETAAIQAGESTRATYAADLEYQKRLQDAKLITDEKVRDNFIKSAKDAHDAAVALAETKDALQANEKAADNAAKALRQFGTSVEKDVLGTVSSIAQGGQVSFDSLARSAESLSSRLLGQIDDAIRKISNDWVDAFSRNQDTSALDAALDKLEKLRGVAGAVGAGLAGYQVGYGAGTANPGSAAGAALSGSFQGAVTGAAIGTGIAPGIGTVIGTVVGETAGLIGGLVGHAKAAHEAKQAEAEVRHEYELSLATYKAAIGVISPIEEALAQNKAQADALRDSIEKGYAGTKNQAEREKKLAEANALEAQGAQKIASDFWKAITQGLAALQGPAGAYQNALAAEDEAYQKNLQSAEALGASESDLQKIRELHEQTIEHLKAAEADRVDQLQASLDAREAEAKGLTDEAEVIRRRATERHELFQAEQEGYTDAQLAQLKYIQSLEDAKAAADALATANQSLAENSAAGPTGTLQDAQAAKLQPLLDQLARDTDAYNAAVKQLADDQAAGADAATLAADQTSILTEATKVAGDQAAITAQQFSDAAALMSQATSQIEKDVQLGFSTPQQGLAYEAQLFGFTGLTTDQIRALYTPFTGTPLTNEQIQQNQNVETYLSDLQKWSGQVTDTLSAVGKAATNPETQSIVNAAQSLTEQTGTRLADTTTSIYVEVRRIRELAESGGAVFRGSVSDLTPVTPNSFAAGPTPLADLASLASLSRFSTSVPVFSPQPLLPPASNDDIVSQLAALLSATPSGAPTVTGPVTVSVASVSAPVTLTVSGSADAQSLARQLEQALPAALKPAIVKMITDAVEQTMANRYAAQLLRDGNPVKPY
jgi:hypothetical protein